MNNDNYNLTETDELLLSWEVEEIAQTALSRQRNALVDDLLNRVRDGRDLVKSGGKSYEDAFYMVEMQQQRIDAFDRAIEKYTSRHA